MRFHGEIEPEAAYLENLPPIAVMKSCKFSAAGRTSNLSVMPVNYGASQATRALIVVSSQAYAQRGKPKGSAADVANSDDETCRSWS